MSVFVRCWVQGPMTRIFPDSQPVRAGGGLLTLTAARGEFECFQVGVRTDGIALNYMRAEPSDLRGPHGSRIPAGEIAVLYPEYVPVKWVAAFQTPGDVERMPPAFFPDPLAPDWQLDVAGPAGPPCRSLWVRVRVPRDARAGLYAGSIAITVGRRNFKAENQAKSVEFERQVRVAYQLRVWDFELPARTTLLNTNWMFPDQLAQWYSVKMWSEPHWTLLGRVAANMEQHRQNVILTPMLGGERPADQMVGVQRTGSCYEFDFRRLERWIKLFLDHGFERFEGQHIATSCRAPIVFWQTPPRGGTPRRVDLRDARGPQYTKFLRQFIPKLWDFLSRRGCQGRWLQHISDEPGLGDLDAYRQLAETVRSAAPEVKLIDALSDPQLADQNDYPVPVEHCYERVVAESHVPRENVWLYYCCGPTGRWPNRFIEYPLIRLRIVTWLCFQNRIPGFLHWGYNYWSAIRKKTHNPWDDPSTHRHPSGDGLMVYPPRDDRMTGLHVIDSIRWEIVREAMEDHEYLVMARTLADAGNKSARKLLADIARDITPGWQNHTRDWKRLYAARARLGALLEKAGA